MTGRTAAALLALLIARPAAAAQPDRQLAVSDPAAFAAAVTAAASSDHARAAALTGWLTDNLAWTATDYRRRSVREILQRGGGNCAELARVTIHLLDVLGVRYRRVREINFHVADDDRQRRAERRVREVGPQGSVFGRRHNDHSWIEIHDRDTGEWFPADPSLGVVGTAQWVQARLAFEARVLLDPAMAAIVAPFAIVAADPAGTVVDRTRHYLVDVFDRHYAGRLSQLRGWRDWTQSLARLGDHARQALAGRYDLHRQSDAIARGADAYCALRAEYLAAHGAASGAAASGCASLPAAGTDQRTGA